MYPRRETDLLFRVVKKPKDRPLRWSKSDDTFVEHCCQTATPCSDSSWALLHSPSRWCCKRHRELQPVNLHMSDKAVQNIKLDLFLFFAIGERKQESLHLFGKNLSSQLTHCFLHPCPILQPSGNAFVAHWCHWVTLWVGREQEKRERGGSEAGARREWEWR